MTRRNKLLLRALLPVYVLSILVACAVSYVTTADWFRLSSGPQTDQAVAGLPNQDVLFTGPDASIFVPHTIISKIRIFAQPGATDVYFGQKVCENPKIISSDMRLGVDAIEMGQRVAVLETGSADELASAIWKKCVIVALTDPPPDNIQ